MKLTKINKNAHKITTKHKVVSWNENIKCWNKSKFKILINYNEYINNTNYTPLQNTFFIWIQI